MWYDLDSEWRYFEECGGEEPELREGHTLSSRDNKSSKLLVLNVKENTIECLRPNGHIRVLNKDNWLSRWEVIAYVSVKDHLQEQINRLHGVLMSQCKNPLDDQ